MRFCGYADVVVINVSWRPFDDAVYFDVALCAMGVDVSMEIACVSVFQCLGELHLGEFDLYVVEC